MPSITVRSVSEDVHDDLETLAARAGVSLSQYLNRQLTVIARLAHVNESFARIDELAGSRPSCEDVVADLRALRER